MLKRFIKYVSQNMLGMLGMSFYILADTFFISKAVGADGITALNLVLQPRFLGEESRVEVAGLDVVHG